MAKIENMAQVLYSTPDQSKSGSAYEMRDWPNTAVSQLLFKLRDGIRDLGHNNYRFVTKVKIDANCSNRNVKQLW